MKRAFYCAGNWKMNKTPQEAQAYVSTLKAELKPEELKDIVLFVPAYCWQAFSSMGHAASYAWGGQNCHWQKSGAFTGENSPEVLAQLGGQYLLVGHSERRQLFGESNEVVAQKAKAAQELRLTPVICIGETLEQRQSSKTESVLTEQLKGSLALINWLQPFWLAYEPVWAIGTGQVATPEQVSEAHGFIRAWLKGMRPSSESTVILYGGSVKADNAEILAKQPNVDGFLVGGASLDVQSLVSIYKKVLPRAPSI